MLQKKLTRISARANNSEKVFSTTYQKTEALRKPLPSCDLFLINPKTKL